MVAFLPINLGFLIWLLRWGFLSVGLYVSHGRGCFFRMGPLRLLLFSFGLAPIFAIDLSIAPAATLSAVCRI